MRTLLVGIDAGCFNVLDPLVDRGAVPTLASLVDDGVSDTLESQIPPWTPSAWPSLYTGVNPGKHGVFGFLSFDGYDWTVVDATHVGEHTIWELADRAGLTSVVVNAPVTHPPPAIDGAVVPGYVAPDEPTCHPEGLLDEIEAAVGDYRVYPGTTNGRGTPSETVAEFRDLARLRGETFRYLADRFAPDFGFVQFQVTDTVLHEFPGDLDRAEQVYRAVDREIGETVDDCDPDTVIVVSDHGMDAYDTRFALNEYLRRRGYAESVNGGPGMPTWKDVRERQLRNGEAAGGRSRAGRAMERLAAAGVTSQRVGALLDRFGLADLALRVAPDELVRAGSEQVDFPSSTAYIRSRVECGVRINLAGRDPEGVVPPEEYEETRQELIDLLSAVETPAGDPVFGEVVPRETYFDGPYTEDAVDVVAVPNDFRTYVTTWLTDDLFDRPDRPAWDHVLEGLFVAAGSGIDADRPPGGPHLFDVAPTVLATLGVPASERMDGTPLPVVDGAGTTTYPPVERAPDGTVDGDVESRLADLGYLE